jgi:hypothetical protein
MKAQLNLEAVYKTIANPAVLLENSSFNRKVPVEVVMEFVAIPVQNLISILSSYG